MPAVLRAALFDLDGVVRRFDPAHPARIEAAHGLPPGTLHEVAFDVGRLGAAVGGGWGFEDWRDAIATELATRFGVDGVAVADRFLAVGAATVDGDVLDVVRELRRKVPVGILSNATSRLAFELEALGLAREFDVVCNSSEVGVAKPDPQAFVLAADRIGHGADECFFTDDRGENVEAAAAVGMTAHHFTGVDGLRRALAVAFGAD